MRMPPPPTLWAKKYGTQDYIAINPFFPWKHGELRRFQVKVAKRSKQPLRRVFFVVSSRFRWANLDTTYKTGPWGRRFLCLEHHASIPFTSRNDWRICRAASEIMAELDAKAQAVRA
jgi:hypothetical protein